MLIFGQTFFFTFFQFLVVIMEIWNNFLLRNQNFKSWGGKFFCTNLVIPWKGLVHWRGSNVHFLAITTARNYDIWNIVARFRFFSDFSFQIWCLYSTSRLQKWSKPKRDYLLQYLGAAEHLLRDGFKTKMLNGTLKACDWQISRDLAPCHKNIQLMTEGRDSDWWNIIHKKA